MIRSGKLLLGLRTTAAALLLAACTTAAPAAGPSAPAHDLAQPRAVAVGPVADQIVDLAERGRFADLGKVIEQLPATATSRDLSASIQAYQKHLDDRRAATRAEYDEALAEANKHIEEGKLEDAMMQVIKAHSLAEHPEKLLNSEPIAKLISDVATKGEAAKAKGDFVDALSLYRLLDLLYEDSRKYHEQYEDAVTHVRVLQLYNPEMLRDLYIERAKRLGNEEDLELFAQSDDEEREDWTTKLDGIEVSMLGQTFAYAATRHIDKDGYLELVRGGIEGLLVMIQTEGIHSVFPGLKDQDKRTAFNRILEQTLADVNRPGRRLTRATAMSIIDSVLQANLKTVALPEKVIIFELTSGATEKLDKFSTVVWPEDLRQFLRSISGNFVGIGVQIQKLDGKLTVVTPLEGTPAMQAGLKANDTIAKVNGAPTGSWSVDRAVREITGPENTQVTLTILREGAEPFDVVITRKQINIESIKGFAHRDEGGWDYWIDQESGIGYIRMTQFLRQTAEDMDKAVAQMKKEGELKGIVLDLRFNPGGLLSTAIGVVDRFVDKGRIVSTVNADGISTSSHSATRRNTYDDQLDLVVLINQGSASASEIVSGALQDYERATVLGVNSYGKGSVQDIFTIAQGQNQAIFKCTTQYYQLPSGRIIHRTDESKQWGIQPDLEVKMTNREVADWLEARRDADVLIAKEDRDPDNPQTDPKDILTDGLDPQLEAAILLLKAKQLSSKTELAHKGE